MHSHTYILYYQVNMITPNHTVFPYTTLFRSLPERVAGRAGAALGLHRVRHQHRRRDLVRTGARQRRSEEHTSELQSRGHLVCMLLLEKTKRITLLDI